MHRSSEEANGSSSRNYTTSKMSNKISDCTTKLVLAQKNSNLGSSINLDKNIVEKPFFGRERSDSDDSLEYFSKVRENGGSCNVFHSLQIASCIQISNRQFPIGEANEKGRHQKGRKYNTVGVHLVRRLFLFKSIITPTRQ